MAKKLSVKQITNKAKQYDETVIITFDEGTDEESQLIFYPYFSDDRIENLVKRFQKDIRSWEELELDINSSDTKFMGLIFYEIVKEFTNIHQVKDPKTDFQVYLDLVKSGYAKQIRNYFVDEEVSKVFDALTDVAVAYEKMQRLQEKYLEQLESLDIQNEEVKNLIKEQRKQIPEV